MSSAVSARDGSASRKLSGLAVGGIAAAVALAGSALWNKRAAAQAERRNPPIGSFVDTAGARLHYLRRGAGDPVVLIHGNGSTIQDWLISGVFDSLAEDHDVIAFDRPGCGYSSRPRSTVWTAEAQAEVIAEAMRSLGIERARVVGHSFGATVAAALALNYPELVERLVLISGFYYPTPRLDSLVSGIVALPIIGDVPRYTVSPIWGRVMKPMMDRMLFSPAPVTESWKRDFPIGLITRPFQLHATAADGALMQQGAMSLAPRYGELHMPVTIVTGDGDKMVNPGAQSMRLHGQVAQSRIAVVSGAGHMSHHIGPEQVIEAVRGETVSA